MKLTPRRILHSFVCLSSVFALAACGSAVAPTAEDGSDAVAPAAGAAVDQTEVAATVTADDDGASEPTSAGRPAGWDEASHGSDAEPNYDVVFPDDTVNQITLTIAPADWEAMLANLTDILGEQGTGDFGGPQGGQAQPGAQPGAHPPQGGPGGDRPEGGQPGGGMAPRDLENPMWVAATLTFNGQTWTNIGVRFKGNSSLRSAWSSGELKLPLKLDFDQFEDDFPEIEDQRFYGFKQLSLANGFSDATFMREVVGYELLEEAGLATAETAYYNVVLDYGEGQVDLGVYVGIEVVDDTVIERVYGSDDGNIYEAEGPAASLEADQASGISTTFQKENNEDEADWSDIEALVAALNSETRTTDPAAWRSGLEAVFNVDTFLNWLAVRTVVQHWDSYGQMAHNYYLYHNPETGQLDFISWDHNMILGSGPGGGGGRRGGMGAATSFDLAEVGAGWPLIRYLLDDPEYQAQYRADLEAFGAIFDAEALTARYRELAEILEPTIARTGDAAAFESAVESLIQTTETRDAALDEYLATLSR